MAEAVADEPSQSGTSPAGPRRKRRRVGVHVFSAAVLAVWAAAAQIVSPYELPSPLRVVEQLVLLLTTAGGLQHVALSLLHVGLSMLLALSIGALLALIPYYVPALRRVLDGRLTPFLNSFPGIGWTMLAIVWLGLGIETILFSVTIIILPFVIVNLREGLRALDTELIEMSQSFGRSRRLTLVTIVLPSLLPFLFAAARVSFGVSWKVVLTAELLGGTGGLGYLMNIASQELNTAQIIAVIVVIFLLVYCIQRSVIDPLQRRFQVIAAPGQP